MPSKSQKWLPDAPAMGIGLMSAWADHEWKTWARSSRATGAPRAASAVISGSGKVLIVRVCLSCACGAGCAPRPVATRAQPGRVKMVRCHGLCATAVLSCMTCLMFVYSSNE